MNNYDDRRFGLYKEWLIEGILTQQEFEEKLRDKGLSEDVINQEIASIEDINNENENAT